VFVSRSHSSIVSKVISLYFIRKEREKMTACRHVVFLAASICLVASSFAADDGHKVNKIAADDALKGIPLEMTPEQLPAQFRTQVRGDAASSQGVAILRQNGNDVEYTFAFLNVTSPVISGHFHKAPHGQVGVRAYSICGVPNESPSCPTGTRGSISGVWKNADIAAFEKGEITIAFHTEKYPAPIGEIAVYIPAKK
jgi:CHRD domain-containing protein